MEGLIRRIGRAPGRPRFGLSLKIGVPLVFALAAGLWGLLLVVYLRQYLDVSAPAVEPGIEPATPPLASTWGGYVLLSACAAFSVGAWIVWIVLRPVKGIARAAARIAAGDLSYPIPAGRGDEIGLLGETLNRMVRRVRELEARVERERRFAAVGGLAAGLAHEIRNPLAAIGGLLELLARDGVEPARRREYAERAEREIEHLRRLTGEILELGRPRPLRREPCDLGEIAARTWALLRSAPEAEGIAFGLEAAPAPVVAEADPEAVGRALLNLYRNAVQAMGGAGRLTVRVARGPEEAVISIRDAGPGIRAEEAEGLFEPFVSGREGGTGLGLYLARQVVEAQGGRIELVPVEGGGAEARIALRAASGTARDGEAGRRSYEVTA